MKKITLSQNLLGTFILHIFKDGQKLGQIDLGTVQDEAKQKARDIADVCANGEFDDQTG